MKNLNLKRKFQYATALVVTTALPAAAMAEGISDIGTTITGEINKLVPIISAVGMSLLSLYVLIKCFKLVSSFATGRS